MTSLQQAPADRRAGRWSGITQWHSWPLLVKLGAVLVVPVVGALALGVLRVHDDIQLAEAYAKTEEVATLRERLVGVVSALQAERHAAVQGNRQADGAAEATTAALASVDDAVEQARALDPSVITGYDKMTKALRSLPSVRAQAEGGVSGRPVLQAYGTLTAAVIEFDRSLVDRFPDKELTGTSGALAELQGAREQLSRQQSIGMFGLSDGLLSGPEQQILLEAEIRLDDRLDAFRGIAPVELRQRYDETVAGGAVAERRTMAQAARDSVRPGIAAQRWDATWSTVSALVTKAIQQAAADLSAKSAALADSVSNRAGAASTLVFAIIVLAAGIGGGVGHYLLRSVGLLRRTALDVATSRLPAAVAATRADDTPVGPIEPVPLHTRDEFGQLARAFDAVHEQAVRSAADEARLRRNLAGIFTNLARRSQSLVERQLRLMEQFEQREDDPDQLANLFKIDHLAARMRRNNEDLLVLSGGMGRRVAESMPLSEVVRAALSEVEQYERVMVQATPAVSVTGYAVGPLIRSVSELVENATTFSPPDSPVAVESRLVPDGTVQIDVLDSGVGMEPDALREANQRLAGGGGVDVPVSRQMGLFVVGRLAARFGLTVRLASRSPEGLCASVLVPAGMVTSLEARRAPAPEGVEGGRGSIEFAATMRKLEAAGIRARLPEVPTALSPAPELFAPWGSGGRRAPYGHPGRPHGFAWLQTTGGAPSRRAGPDHPGRPPAAGSAGRSATRTRGFLSGFQAGIQRSESRTEETER